MTDTYIKDNYDRVKKLPEDYPNRDLIIAHWAKENMLQEHAVRHGKREMQANMNALKKEKHDKKK